MSTVERLQTLFQEDKRASVLEMTARMKACSFFVGMGGGFASGLGCVIIQKSGLWGGVVGFSILFLGGLAMVGARDIWHVCQNTEDLFHSRPDNRARVSLSAHLTADTILKQCLILNQFKSSLVRALDSQA
jgi:hypothetical protein